MSNVGGFWIRLSGLLLDGIILGGFIFLVISISGLDTASRAVQAGEGIITLLYFVLIPVLWYGYTVGKRIAGIRIVKTDGSRVTVGTMLMRYVVEVFYMVFRSALPLSYPFSWWPSVKTGGLCTISARALM